GGRVRHLANPDGDAIVERLEAFDQADRSYTYSILQAPFPVSDYRSTLRVVEQGDGSRIDWSGEFTPVGVSNEEASALFEGIYRDGLKALETTLAG
ncbi:SRPBCC family protein, partial [Stenotrophomonas maltophilia]|uniref:SRPBCC family protein n=2 Tax=Lysobacteraceae TaxID=32033 RepID=UPI00066DE800